MVVKFKRLSDTALGPSRAHETDAGYDLFADQNAIINPGDVIKISTNIAAGIPKGWYGRISERSSMGSKGVAVRGGVVDESYTGHIIVCLSNVSKSSYAVEKGDKIAQLVFHQYGDFAVELVDSLETTERGDKGFGSSGR